MSSLAKPLCTVQGCNKKRIHRNTRLPYCEMHKARFRRYGRFGLRDKSFHKLEKLPHTVDVVIRERARAMIDRELAEFLHHQGFVGATEWTVKYRRRKLGLKKYDCGNQKKHKAWIRQEALRIYGRACELCGYNLFIETHHIIPKCKGGPDEVENLLVVCSNCHILLTRNYIRLFSRAGIPQLRRFILLVVRPAYPYLG